MSSAVVEVINKQFGDAVLSTAAVAGDETVTVEKGSLRAIAQYLKDDAAMAFNMPIDVTAVDYLSYPGHEGPRFQVVYHFYSTTQKHRIRLKVGLDLDDMTVDSLCSVWRGVNWFEREVWDMFGVEFQEHPDLRRILMYEEFEGHPLRKDYPLRGYQPLVPIERLDDENEDPKMSHIDLNPPPPSVEQGS
jgi:NADH-quinone oxidoreductase subunit C